MPNSLKTVLREIGRNLLVLVALAGTATVAFAFTEPSSGPTNGTVYAPVNTSGTAQRKTGSLSVGAGGAGTNDVTINTAGGVTAEGTVSGNILNATTQVSSPQYCIGVSCITAWPAGGGSSVGSAGTVQFSNGLGGFNGDAVNFFWDNTNDRIGIRTATPSTNLHVVGGARVTGLASCNTIDTDASGNLVCGTDETGAGSGMYDNLNWIVATRVNSAGDAVGSSIVGPVPNGWTIATVQSWMRNLAIGFGWSIVYDHLAVSPTSVDVPNGKMCDAVPPALPTNRPCHYYFETTGTDLGSWANNGTGILVTTAKKLGIGTVTPGAGLEVKTDVTPLKLWNTTSGAGYWMVGPNSSNAFQVINQNSPGIGMYMNSGATSWTGTSDFRLKENVSAITDALQKILQLRGVTFNFKGNDQREIGVIAQEVQPHFPELVSAGPNGYLGVSYDRLAPILIEAMKEQQKEIDSLKARIEALEKR